MQAFRVSSEARILCAHYFIGVALRPHVLDWLTRAHFFRLWLDRLRLTHQVTDALHLAGHGSPMVPGAGKECLVPLLVHDTDLGGPVHLLPVGDPFASRACKSTQYRSPVKPDDISSQGPLRLQTGNRSHGGTSPAHLQSVYSQSIKIFWIAIPPSHSPGPS